MQHALRGILMGAAVALVSCEPGSGAGNPGEAPERGSLPADALAVVDGVAILPEDVDAAIELEATAGRSIDRETALDRLINQHAYAARGRERGLEKDPEIAAILRRLVARRYEVLELERRIGGDPDEAQLRAYYDSHPELFRQLARAHAAIVLARHPEGASAEEREATRLRMENARALASRLPPRVRHFGDVALEYSDDAGTKLRGGDLGWISEASTSSHGKLVSEKVFALESPGELSPVFEIANGHAVVRLIEREEPRLRPFEDVRGAVDLALRREREARARAELIAESRAKSRIEILSPAGEEGRTATP